jgi:hypothetical protein
MRKCEKKTTGHDFARDNEMGPIGIYPSSPIEEVSSDFLGVEDNHWLTGYIQVDEITWSGPSGAY